MTPPADTLAYLFGVLWLLVFLWTLPTVGLLVNSFREPRAQRRSGWWNAFTDPNFTMSATFALIIFVLVLPVMIYNVRQTREA